MFALLHPKINGCSCIQKSMVAKASFGRRYTTEAVSGLLFVGDRKNIKKSWKIS